MVSGSVFGQTGPLAQSWGVDGTGAALSGRTLLTGWPDRGPVIPSAAPYGDVIVPFAMAASVDRGARTPARAAAVAATSTRRCTSCACSRCARRSRPAARRPRAPATPMPACSIRACTPRSANGSLGGRHLPRRRAVASLRARTESSRPTDAAARDAALAHWCASARATTTRSSSCRISASPPASCRTCEDLFERDPADPRAPLAGAAGASAARHLRPHAHAHRLLALTPAPFRAPSMGEHNRQIAAASVRTVRRLASKSWRHSEFSNERARRPRGGQRSRKDLACTAAATAHQREFVADLKRRVIDNGEPFAIAQADTPHEIFHAMDIPLISNQWWSAYISAKQLSPRYFAVLDKLGYPVQQLPLLLARAGLHARQRSRRPRPGAACPSPRCWSRASPANASATCSANGPKRWAANSFRSKRRAGRTRIRTGSRSRSDDWEAVVRTAAHRAAGAGDARADRTARDAHRPPLRRAEVRGADARRQRAGRLHRRGRAHDRRGAALPGVHRRPDAEHDDPAVASRLRLGGGARAPLPRRSGRARRQGRGGQQQRARAPHVDRRGPVARPRLLQRARRPLRRGVRLVDVHAFRGARVHPRAPGPARCMRWRAASAR